MDEHQPAWRSKKFSALCLVAAVLVGALFLGAPESVTTRLSEAILLGLPIYLGGQSWIDKTKSSQI